MIRSRKRALYKFPKLKISYTIECKWYKYEKKINHKNAENSNHSAGNMQFFEINHAGSIAAHWKYDSITEKVHLSILQY